MLKLPAVASAFVGVCVCLEHIPPASNRGIPKGLRMSESGALIPFWKDRVMAKPYSDDLRVRAIAIVEGGASRHEVAALLEVSPSSVINWLRRWSDDGSSAAKPSGGSVSPLEKHAGWLLALITAHPDLTLDEAVTSMRRRRIVGSRSALSRFFIRHDITFKKKACGPRSRLGPTSPAREDAGFESKARLTLHGWCLSTRPPPAPRWCGSTVDVHGAFD